MLGPHIWAPLRGQKLFPVRVLSRRDRHSWARGLQGDVFVGIKPRQDSLGLALEAGQISQTPVIADVDDWEMAFYYDYPARFLKHSLAFTSPRNIYRTKAAERKVQYADAVTVSTSWLQQRFGGVIIEHARDGAAFNPGRFNRSTTRERLGIAANDCVVLFMGTVMRHKGVNEIAECVRLVDNPDLLLATPPGFVAPLGVRHLALPNVDFENLPELLSCADVVLLPQRDSRASRAQLPAKIFDALFMGLPTIVTDVSDLRDVVGNAGVVVAPGDLEGMAAALQDLSTNESLRATLGRRARARALDRFSEEALAPRWLEVVDKVLQL